MIYHLKQVLNANELRQLREIAARARWDDGRKSAGDIAAPVKHNDEVAPDSPEGKAASEIAVQALRRNSGFFNLALVARMSPPMLNRYATGSSYGDHFDAAILGRGTVIRSDLSATLFISDPSEYDGGELVIDLIPGGHATRLDAGDLMVYPATTIHHVTPVTRGARIAMIFWVQSMVRDPQRRAMLYDLSRTLDVLEPKLAKTPELTQLYGCYYNLVRMWAEP